jgi:hypothetical protein
MGCKKQVLKFNYNQKTSGSSTVVATGVYTGTGSGTFTNNQGYRVLYDTDGQLLGNFTFSSQINNLQTGVAGFYVIQEGTFFIPGEGNISWTYPYLNTSGTSAFPSGINKYNIGSGTGSFLNASGTITIDANNTTGERTAVIKYIVPV